MATSLTPRTPGTGVSSVPGYTPLLIIGAGPFGLALAAEARRRGIDHQVVGKPMESWRAHMPPGMILRSPSDWHLDPGGVDTIERYTATQGKSRAEVEPLSLPFYLDYAAWFQARQGINALSRCVERLAYDERGMGRFRATLEDGHSLVADAVVLAVGFGYFAHVPAELAALTAALHRGRVAHTRDLVDFGPLAGARCLIVGGRQSAFEWAALLRERGAATVHVVHRHSTPAFAPSDWSWVTPLMERLATDPGWYRRLPVTERDALACRLWAEGRLKLEPWLAPRLAHETIHLLPYARIASCAEQESGELAVTLDSGERLAVDQIILATGYHGLPRATTGYHGLPRATTGYHGLPRATSWTWPESLSWLGAPSGGPWPRWTVFPRWTSSSRPISPACSPRGRWRPKTLARSWASRSRIQPASRASRTSRVRADA
jgi:FAD-dependent urate hydroxylase